MYDKTKHLKIIGKSCGRANSNDNEGFGTTSRYIQFSDYENYGARIQEDPREEVWSDYDNYRAPLTRPGDEDYEQYTGEVPRKRVRIRVPVVRSRTERQQHKFTVVRKKPLVPYTKDHVSSFAIPETFEKTSSSQSPRRIVVTRVRALGAVPLTDLDTRNRHKITITRRRKIQSTNANDFSPPKKVRVTRKKLITVRPVHIEPTPTIAIITTGFFTAPSYEDPDDETYEDDDEEMINNKPEISQEIDHSPELIPSTVDNTPVIITDNFFYPESNNDEDEESENGEEGSEEDKQTTPASTTIEVETKEPLSNTEKPEIIEEVTTSRESDEETETTTTSLTEVSMDMLDEEVSTKPTPEESYSDNTTPVQQFEVPDDEDSSSPPTTETIPDTTPNIPDHDNLTVKPIESEHNLLLDQQSTTILEDTSPSFTLETSFSSSSTIFDDSDIPTVIPLDTSSSLSSDSDTKSDLITTTHITSPTSEDIAAGLADDLYLSLSHPDFPQIFPTTPLSSTGHKTLTAHDATSSSPVQSVSSTSVYYTETVVTSTRLRTYTYVVTKLNGQETEVTSSTTIRPRVTTLTLTVPVTVTVAPTVESPDNSVSPIVHNPHPAIGESEETEGEEEGRRLKLATRVMSNGVEVIVAGPTPALRWENSNPQPTLTLSDTVVMMLPQEQPNDFVTKTCTTTFTYFNTYTANGTTIVSTDQQVVANTATEERHRKPGLETAAVTLEASPTLHTEVFKTTYTYWTLNTDHPDISDPLESSTKVITNTVTAPQHYLNMVLEPSEPPRPETNTYLSTRVLEKTFMQDGKTKIETTSDMITQLIVTESGPPPRPTSVTTTLTALDNTEESMTENMKTYYITYTYFTTIVRDSSTVVSTNIATSSDIILEKVPIKKTTTKTAMITPTPEPIKIYATKTYLTTFTYFTTLLQADPNGNTSTTVSTRCETTTNVVTESIAPSLLDAGYMNALLTTSTQHSDTLKNVVTGSTIIFFDEEDQIDPTTTAKIPESTVFGIDLHKDDEVSDSGSSTVSNEANSETNNESVNAEQTDDHNKDEDTASTSLSNNLEENKRPTPTASSGTTSPAPTTEGGSDLQVSNLLNLGSLGINGLSALRPMISAMAGLLQGKNSNNRRNDTAQTIESQEVTTQRSPIYIPVAEFADGDIETAESQNMAHVLNVNHNYIPDTRHKVATSLADGIPISPGEVITANSDVIIGKPGKMGPRPPPHTFLKEDEHIGMKPPPLPIPNIPVHPVLEILEEEEGDKDSQAQSSSSIQSYKVPQIQIVPAHQVYEEHQQVPISVKPQKLHPVQNAPPKRISSKHDIMQNDPLLKPPNRVMNSDMDLKPPAEMQKIWSERDPLKPPPPPPLPIAAAGPSLSPPPPPYDEMYPEESKIERIRPDVRPPWAQKDPIILADPETVAKNPDSNPQLRPLPAEPIIHQVPHVIDRSTGQPLLVNIQPSQVANVVIPQGGTQALIFGDTNEPHISGQYFDDPSPYPEPEINAGYVSIQKVENSPQYSNDQNPMDYIVPPSPSIKKLNSLSRPSSAALSTHTFNFPQKQQDKLENFLTIPGRMPSEVHLIKRPEGPGGGQGHLHTEILVHHRPETVNIRPHSGSHSSSLLDSKYRKPAESISPPRRTEVSNTHENSHRYIFLGKPDSGNEISLATGGNWKSDKKPSRIGRPRPPLRHPLRSSTNRHDRPIYIERPGHSVMRKPIYSLQSHRSPPKSHIHYRPQTVRHQISNISNIQLSDEILSPHTLNNRVNVLPPEDEHLPTGAVEYHNPLNPKVEKYTPQQVIPTTMNPQTFNQWTSNSQTEKTLDSHHQASEYVKFHGHIYNQGTDMIKKTGDNNFIIFASLPTNGNTTKNLDSSYNKNVMTYGKVGAYVPEQHYHTRPYDLPIVQGKPFGVYNGQVDAGIPYGYKRQENTNDKSIVADEIVQGVPFNVRRPTSQFSDTVDLKPPAIISQFEMEMDRPQHNIRTPEIITKSPPTSFHSTSENFDINSHQSENQTVDLHKNQNEFRNETVDITRVGVHPEYPHILMKPKPHVPKPITISTGAKKPIESNDNKPTNIRFSMAVDATGEEHVSKTQTERPPSMFLVKKDNKNNDRNEETLETAYQTNFASSDMNQYNKDRKPLTDMKPPPLRPDTKKDRENTGLKPPPLPSTDVVGLSPPPVDLTTTVRPSVNNGGFESSRNHSNSKSTQKYIPIKESNQLQTIVSPPSNPRPTMTRPFIMELLSQDMVPPPPVVLTTTRPLEIATVRPAVAVSGSIQIGTAVATSHIPVIQDMESRIPIIHGTVDLPVVVDVPEILRPLKTQETRMTEHVSIYTVRPFDTKFITRTSIEPMTKMLMPSVMKATPPQTTSSTSSTKTGYRTEIPRNPVKRPENPIFLESSYDNLFPTVSTRIEPTESLTQVVGTDQSTDHRHRSKLMMQEEMEFTKTNRLQMTHYKKKNMTEYKSTPPTVVTRIRSSVSKVTNTRLPERNPYVPQRINNSRIVTTKSNDYGMKDSTATTTRMTTKPKEVIRFETSTMTRVETSVLGSPPTTRTLLLTHTLTSTTVETVTETVLRPTSVISTITSTILHSIPTTTPYENPIDNDSIFVVMSDQKPPEPGAEEVEAEYGDEEISRDEQDPETNKIHRVLAGGTLGASTIPLQPSINQCIPECRASKSEVCAEMGNEMRCVCRPGFARMFPDRPCKPTYTYTVQIGLHRVGQEALTSEVALNDTNSMSFKRLSSPIREALDRTLMQSDLRDIYRGLKIHRFSSEPTRVEFHVQMTDNANETRLKEVLQKYLIGSNYSLGGTEVFASNNLELINATDFNECSMKEGGPYHDCSPHATCFNLRGTYQCSCKEGWADLSENPAYPGRICSQAPLGCAACNNKGHCVINSHGNEVCDCFPWHSGQRCQVNLKVLLIALVTTGAILLGLLIVCVALACIRNPNRRNRSGDRRAMIPGTGNGGDTSSEGSVTDLTIPHHVPHILPPPPQMIAPLPPAKRAIRKISDKPRHPPRRKSPVPMIATQVPVNDERRDRSLTVMIPRAKYRSTPQSPQHYKSMSTFAAEEHKLISYLESGVGYPVTRKLSVSSTTKDCKEPELQVVRTPVAPNGALVSAGFQVSATVTRTLDADSTLARSCGDTTIESSTKVLSGSDLQDGIGSTLARSCGNTTIPASMKLLRLDQEDCSTLARSCGDTTIRPPTQVATRRNSMKDSSENRDHRDSMSMSEGQTMPERDLGSTLRLPAPNPPLYSPDRASDRDSNFDSL